MQELCYCCAAKRIILFREKELRIFFSIIMVFKRYGHAVYRKRKIQKHSKHLY